MTQKAKALRACRAIQRAYDDARNSGSVEWNNLDEAYRLACDALGVNP